MGAETEHYVKVYSWMWHSGLTGYELLVFAMIHSMTQAGKPFSGSAEWLADCFGMSVQMAKKTLLRLTEKGYLTRRKTGRRYEYTATTVAGKGYHSSQKKLLQEPKKATPVAEKSYSSSPDNIIDIKGYIKPHTKVCSSTRAPARERQPRTEDVAAYCRERGYAVNVPRFMAYNEARGWKIGGNAAEDWRQLVELWVSNGQDEQAQEQDDEGREKFRKWLEGG